MKTNFTVIDPIPSHIPRQLAIELLQNHGELIHVNPLVLDYHAIKAPRDAPSDEFYATWYEINQRIQFVPGMGKMGSGKVSFRGCFHDMAWGVQSHMYVPLGIDLRHKYQIRGNQPGEPPEQRELGSDAPMEGLYLRTDIEIKANMTMMSFVKKEQRAANKIMIERMIKKAELIDAGVLQAMFNDNGKLSTVNPNDRTASTDAGIAGPMSPSVYGPNGINLRSSTSVGQNNSPQSAYGAQQGLNSTTPNRSPQPPAGFAVEMMGDTHYQEVHHTPNLHPAFRSSTYSELGASSPRWSQGVQSDRQSDAGGSTISGPTAYGGQYDGRSPKIDGYGGSGTVEMPDNERLPPRPPKESPDPRAQYNQGGWPPQSQQTQQPQQGSTYNPQHYAGLSAQR